MKTTKRIIKNRLLNDKTGNTKETTQKFIDDLFPDTDMDIIIETDDEDMEDEVKGEVGEYYYNSNVL